MALKHNHTHHPLPVSSPPLSHPPVSSLGSLPSPVHAFSPVSSSFPYVRVLPRAVRVSSPFSSFAPPPPAPPFFPPPSSHSSSPSSPCSLSPSPFFPSPLPPPPP